MYGLNLTPEELTKIVSACRAIFIEHCTPPYLQDFIAQRLDEQSPALALKIRGLLPDAMHHLCEYIKGLQCQSC